MKVAFYVYPIAFQSPGGGEILLLKTREYLEKSGLKVSLFDPWKDKLSSFDLLHTFGSVKDSLRMMETARKVGVRNVLSTVCWYSWKSAWGANSTWPGRTNALLRHAAKHLLPALPSGRRRMMEISDALIPNSRSEALQLSRFFRMPEEKIFVIPNAADPGFAEAKPDLFHESYPHRDFILCVGRIEPRKNQLNIIRALKGISRAVVFIGDYVKDYKDYYDCCRREAGSNIHFLGPIPHDSPLLASAYAACNTFLLATWLETPGLAALEAGLAGAKVVITREGATREYFNDYVLYVSPEDQKDIRSKTLEMCARKGEESLKRHIEQRFLWPEAARLTLEVYEKVLKRK